MGKQNKLLMPLCSVFMGVILFSILLCAAGASTLITAIGYIPSVLGQWLRAMSLSGSFGNSAAILIYVLLAASPLSIPIIYRIRNKRIDAYYCAYGGVGAATLFYVIYMAINPAVLLKQFAMTGESTEAISSFAYFMLTVLTVSIIVACLTCELTRKKNHANLSKDIVLIIFTCVILIGFAFPAFFESLAQIWHMNEAYGGMAELGHNPTAQYSLIVSGFIITCGRLILFTVCLWLALSLFLSMNNKVMDEAEKTLAQRLNKLLKISLLVSALSTVFINILQLILIKRLLDINIAAYIPAEIFIYAASLIISKYVIQAAKIKQEQDLTI